MQNFSKNSKKNEKISKKVLTTSRKFAKIHLPRGTGHEAPSWYGNPKSEKIDMKTQIKMTPRLGLKLRRLNDLAETITVILRKINGQTKVDRYSYLYGELNVHLEWVECEINQRDKSNLFDVAEYGCENWTAWTANLRKLCIEMLSVDGYRDHARYLDADSLRTPVTTAVASFGEFSRIAREEIEIVK